MDRTKMPVYGRQEQSAYNKHYESICYHPLTGKQLVEPLQEITLLPLSAN